MLELLKTFVFLAAVIDPLGSIPVFLEATKNFDNAAKKRIAVRATMFATVILIFFIVVGQIIMEAMQISLFAFQISGGAILFLFSLTMVFGHGKTGEETDLVKNYEHVTIFPIAMPSIASPGAIMAVVLLTDNYAYSVAQQFVTTLIVILVLILTGAVLLMSRKIQDTIGETGITVISRIMGLILASFAIQNILDGVQGYFKL
jgi:multiple antibiotic resistance protein